MALNKDKVMESARKFVDKGQIDKAVKEYLRIVQEDPKDVRVWLKIGDLYAKKGAKQEATETYLKVARFYHDQGFIDKAIAVYKQILKLDPRLVDVILKLAELYKQRGNMIEAMQHLESVAAHFHREGNTKDALGTVVQLVALDPENIATRIKLAELYSKEQMIDDAAREFQYACEQLRRQGRQDDFIKVAERLLFHTPTNHTLNRELAGLYLRRNDPRRALQKLQTSFKADPRDVETLGLLAQAFQALDQKAKTVSVLKELARVHTDNKQKDKAVDVFRKILEFVPNDPDAMQFLGQARPVAPEPPPPRQHTPLPAQVRAATGHVKFNLTTDIPAVNQAPNLTGSMPLVDEQSLSGADFALPEYADDGDFSADMEPAADPRQMSAAGERHADEISKILAETDVYVKYGLHQKAVDHLRRIFSLDPENIEAHERLKDIFVSQGREQEAEHELLQLAEVIAPSDPDRAEAYLHELLAINGTHTGAFDLARRFRLRVARSHASEQQYAGGGGVAAVDPDLEELALDAAPRAASQRPMGIARQTATRDSIDDFDPNELISPGRVAHGSPAPGRPPQPPAYAYDLDLESSPAHQQRQMLPTRQIPDDHAILEARPPANQWSSDESTTFAPPPGFDDQPEIPFDPAAAREFDGVAPDTTYGGAAYGAYDSPTGQTPGDTGSYDAVGEDGLSVSGSYDPYGTDAGQTAEPAHVTSARADSNVEDELEEADFYAGQGMYPEAVEVLRTMLARYPGHRLITGKLRDLESMMGGGGGGGVLEDPIEIGDDAEAAGGTDALDLDEIEEVDADDFEEVDAVAAPASTQKKRGPTVMLEKPVDDSDGETHFDLGLAYKEMGLHDEAIKAFENALRSPGKEVSARVMIGMCLRESGNAIDAVQQFKQGLHARPSEREIQSLYYEIGITYEQIGDAGEAIYYFESVMQRDPQFADAAQRVAYMRAQGHRAAHNSDDGF